MNLIVGLLQPPERSTCQAQKLLKGESAVHKVSKTKSPGGKLLSGLAPFGSTGKTAPTGKAASTRNATASRGGR